MTATKENNMSDRDYLYGYICRHGSLARSCQVCDLEDEVRRLRAELERARLRSIEARNPGVDMERVKRELDLFGDSDEAL